MVRSFVVMGLLTLLVGCGEAGPIPAGGADLSPGRCGRGFVVVHSDYASSSVSILHADGAVAQPHFLSSASATTGLSAPLSGDVVVPTARLSGDEVVLIDRHPAAILTFVAIDSGLVRAQLDVGTGFAANPQDYLPLHEGAYVSRYEDDPAPGSEPHDGGSDVLRIDPAVPTVVGRIDLSASVADAPGFLPRPNRMARVGDLVVVLLSAYAPGFADSAPSRLSLIDPEGDTIVATHRLEGLHGCSALAVREGTTELAVACTGRFDGDSDADPATSGVALLELGPGGLVEIARWDGDALGRPAGFGLAFAGSGNLWATTLGTNLHQVLDDRLVEIDRAGAVVERWRGPPFTLGEIRCATPVGDEPEGPCGACLVTDAGAGVIQRFVAGERSAIAVDDGIGLPPRYLGRL
jgi:hypothetical protein